MIVGEVGSLFVRIGVARNFTEPTQCLLSTDRPSFKLQAHKAPQRSSDDIRENHRVSRTYYRVYGGYPRAYRDCIGYIGCMLATMETSKTLLATSPINSLTKSLECLG